MRSEQEMLDLIVCTAQGDDRIRAAIMNGSRANPNAPRDFFQDFDIVYFVTDVASFKDDPNWIELFGERMIMQLPEDMQDPFPKVDGGFAYLMQFTDGNRIDLGIYPLTKIADRCGDSLSLQLLDKDGLIAPFAPTSETDYLPKPPTAKLFADCCNEFWWCCPYVVKGLWREEILYAKTMLDEVLRAELMKILRWQIGVQTGFSANPGKLGKYFKRYLEPALWEALLETYADATYDNTWDALFAMCDLFETVGLSLADRFGFEYPHDDARRVRAHLEHVRRLPKDAKEMYE